MWKWNHIGEGDGKVEFINGRGREEVGGLLGRGKNSLGELINKEVDCFITLHCFFAWMEKRELEGRRKDGKGRLKGRRDEGVKMIGEERRRRRSRRKIK